MGARSSTEIEVKLRVDDVAAAQRRAWQIGAVWLGRVHEQNILFDTPPSSLRKHGELLRLRTAGRRAVLTHKGPSLRGQASSRYKERAELECLLDDAPLARRIIEAAGLRAVFRYEKFRTTFLFPVRVRWARGLHLELDQTPAGNYWELEGPRAAIDRAARLLGYSKGDYLTASYMGLWSQWRRRQGVPAGDMLFLAARGAKKRKSRV